MLKDYPTLFAGEAEHSAAESLAKRVKHISEFVAQSPVRPVMAPAAHEGQSDLPFLLPSAGGRGDERASRDFEGLPGVEFVEMPDADRCAGGAGTYLVKDFDTSQRIVERKRQAVEDSGANLVATSCPACMIQLRTGLRGAAEVKHVAQLIQEAYEAADRS